MPLPVKSKLLKVSGRLPQPSSPEGSQAPRAEDVVRQVEVSGQVRSHPNGPTQVQGPQASLK